MPTTQQTDKSLCGHSPEDLAERFALKPFQGRQLFKWLHQKQVFDYDRMSDLPKDVRARLHAYGPPNRLTLVDKSVSPTSGTKKVLLQLPDGETVESVFLQDRDRITLCISTQVGCAVKCSFCATGVSGFARNLSPGEIVEQALYLLAGEDLQGRTPNIVYMGMGEPFRNYDATVASIHLLMHPQGLNIGARKITVSTAGEIPGIEAFAQLGWQVRLSISLHAANDELRNVLVPLNRKYPLLRLRDAADYYQRTTGRQITYEWTLLKDVNDTPEAAAELIDFIGDSKAFVNLIPYNPVAGLGYDAPTRARCEAFRDQLDAAGIKATLRVERGQDINAACGQLRRQHVSTN